jgi:hypothetical protein
MGVVNFRKDFCKFARLRRSSIRDVLMGPSASELRGNLPFAKEREDSSFRPAMGGK